MDESSSLLFPFIHPPPSIFVLSPVHYYCMGVFFPGIYFSFALFLFLFLFLFFSFFFFLGSLLLGHDLLREKKFNIFGGYIFFLAEFYVCKEPELFVWRVSTMTSKCLCFFFFGSRKKLLSFCHAVVFILLQCLYFFTQKNFFVIVFTRGKALEQRALPKLGQSSAIVSLRPVFW